MVFSYLGILAIGLINEALDEGDAQKTLQALQIPAAKLEGVLAEVAQHYQDTLIRAKREKAQASGIEMVPFCLENFILPRTKARGGISPLIYSVTVSWEPLHSDFWRNARCEGHRLRLLGALLFYTCGFFVVVDTSLTSL